MLYVGPLLTAAVMEQIESARRSGSTATLVSLNLELSTTLVILCADYWMWNDMQFPYVKKHKERTVYYWHGGEFQPISRYGSSLVKLIPTDWGPPTFEIDGIKMLPTAQVSPYLDAQHKVELVRPRGKVVLDCCGGLGYFAAWCVRAGARQIVSYEKNSDVLWLRSLNPWSPPVEAPLTLMQADVTRAILSLADGSIDAALHDPPRFGIAGELYSNDFYRQLARVLRRRGRLFHYTGAPNKVTTGRDVAREVADRLRYAGFSVEKSGDGILAVKD